MADLPPRTPEMTDAQYAEALRVAIFELQQRYQLALKVEAAPMIAELVRLIDKNRPPVPSNDLVGPDGTVYQTKEQPNG